MYSYCCNSAWQVHITFQMHCTKVHKKDWYILFTNDGFLIATETKIVGSEDKIIWKNTAIYTHKVMINKNKINQTIEIIKTIVYLDISCDSELYLK